MAAEQRKLLEQLMGAEALMGASAAPQEKLGMTDQKVCRSYLVGQCPHDLFANTKSDLGPCPKTHSENLKAEYEAASDAQREEWGFSYDMMRHYWRYIEECNKSIEKNTRHLANTESEVQKATALLKESTDMSTNIDLGIEELEIMFNYGGDDAEIHGHVKGDDDAGTTKPEDEDGDGDGNDKKPNGVNGIHGSEEDAWDEDEDDPHPFAVNEEDGFPLTYGLINYALKDHHRLRGYLQRKVQAERELKNLSDTGGPSGHQKLQVCMVCGAYLSRLDNDRRLADHFSGKMHLGYAHLRNVHEKLSNEWKDKDVGPGRDREYNVFGRDAVPADGGYDGFGRSGYGGGGGGGGGGGYGGGFGGGGGYGGRGGGGGWGGGRGGRGRGRGRGGGRY